MHRSWPHRKRTWIREHGVVRLLALFILLLCFYAPHEGAQSEGEQRTGVADSEEQRGGDAPHPVTVDAGRMWLERIDAAERVPHSYSEITQTTTTSSGSERTLKARSWTSDNNDISLTAYISPARVRGDKILIRDGGDNIWYYMHRRDVTRHFVGHTRRQKAMGSDFSYQDLAYGNMAEDYTAKVLGFEPLDSEECVKLHCVPTEHGPSYDHLIIWASTADHLTRRIEYYDDRDLLKTLYISEFRMIENRKTPMQMNMINHEEGSNTVMITETITFSTIPDPRIFTKSALSREIGRP